MSNVKCYFRSKCLTSAPPPLGTRRCNLFTKLDKHASAHQARLLFLKIDDNGGGTVSLGELIPVVFNRASGKQVRQCVAMRASVGVCAALDIGLDGA